MPGRSWAESGRMHGMSFPRFQAESVTLRKGEDARTSARAYPDEAQEQVLSRTFGWRPRGVNRILAERHRRWHAEHKGTSWTPRPTGR